MGRPRTSLGHTEYRCILGRAHSSGQWGGGCGKGFPIMGVAPKSREGTARQAPGFHRLWGTSGRSKTKRRGAAGSNRDPLTNLRPLCPCAGRASLPAAGRLLPPPPPNLASAPVLLKSPRDPARGRGCGGHALFHAGSLANQRGARGAAAREPKPGRLLPRRAEPDRAEPSQAEPGAQSAGGGGAEPR